MEKFGYLCKAKTLAVFGAACLATATSAFAASAIVQKLNYTDQLQSFYNPDRGFYRPQLIHFKPEGVDVNPYYKNRLMHLRAEISAFSSNAVWTENDQTVHGTTQDLTEAMLNSFRTYLDRIRATNSTIIVRFSYDPKYGGKGDMEPSQEWILKHVKQLSTVFNEYKDVITFVEQGMYGPFGEQHTSAISNPLYVGEGLATLLQNTDDDVDVGPRNPSVLARGLGFSPTTELNTAGDTIAWSYNVSFNVNHPYFKMKADSIGKDIYRAGIYNDCYVGTQYDYGTWGGSCNSSVCRERGVAYLENYAHHVPYGGEACSPPTDSTGKPLYAKINTAKFISYEGFRTHTSYLNYEHTWSLTRPDGGEWRLEEFHPRDTIDKAYESYIDGEGVLQNSAFKYIDDHLGYRYVLRESKMMDSLGIGSLLQLDMKIQNVGFGNMTKKRPVTIMLRRITESAGDTTYGTPLELKQSGNFDPQNILCRKVVLKSAFDNNGNIADYDNVKSETTFDGINEVKVATKLPDTLAEGNYAVYLRISQYGNWPADSNYSVVRFANDSAYYDKETGANYVGSFVLSKKAPVVTAIPAQKLAKVGRTIRLENHGQTLTVTNAKRVEIFDLMGHKLLTKDLQETTNGAPTGATTVPLKNLPRTSLVIRTH